MKQEIICHNGKCWEVKKGKPFFDDLFEENNIVKKIEKDLLKNSFYGM